MTAYENILWKAIDPEETKEFWKSYWRTSSLPPAAIEQRPAAHGLLSALDPSALLGDMTSRESLVASDCGAVRRFGNGGEDLRPRRVEDGDRARFPYCTVGKLLFTLSAADKSQIFEGTAFVVRTKQHGAALTAAHCLLSERNAVFPRQWAQNVVFIPFFDGRKESLRARFQSGDLYFSRGLAVPRGWADAGLDSPLEFDLGGLLLEWNGRELVERTGALGWIAGDFATDDYPSGVALGHPFGGDFDGDCLWETRVKLSFQDSVGSFPHIRMKGNLLSRGASGGPVIVSSGKPPRWHAIGASATLSSYGPDFVYWDSPRFGRTLVSMIRLLESSSLGNLQPITSATLNRRRST